MSEKYLDVSSSEDELVVDETPARVSKKRPQKGGDSAHAKRSKRVPRRLNSSDEEELATPLPPSPPPLPPKKKKHPLPPENGTDESQKWQEVMETARKFMSPLKVDTKALTMLFDQSTYDCFNKACQAWLKEQGIAPNLTYTSQKSFVAAMARFVFDFTLRHCQVEGKPNVNVTGAAIWSHGCDVEMKCLHGTPMIQKEQVIEMDVTSENGQRALKEQPQKAKVTQNRWGRNVVQLRNSEALACVNDANSAPGNFNNKSCGVFYNDGGKAQQAFRQIMAFQLASYPKMPNAGTRLLMPVKCDCNYLNTGMPLMGRQICKMTPFALSAPQGIDESCVEDAAVLASLRNPAILVFQCCNPVYRGSRASNQKNCDFKISAPDFINALQLAKRFWNTYFSEEAPKVIIPEFKWSQSLQYQNSILPTPSETRDECLF